VCCDLIEEMAGEHKVERILADLIQLFILSILNSILELDGSGSSNGSMSIFVPFTCVGFVGVQFFW
jgi:hypothetical protein